MKVPEVKSDGNLNISCYKIKVGLQIKQIGEPLMIVSHIEIDLIRGIFR